MEPESILAPVTDPYARTWGMLAHLLSLVGYVILIGFVIPPLVIYLAKKDENEFIADQARESLNFQLTILLMYVAFSVGLFLFIWLCVGIVFLPLLLLLTLFHFVMVIVAAMQAHEGKRYRYPLTLRFLG